MDGLWLHTRTSTFKSKNSSLHLFFRLTLVANLDWLLWPPVAGEDVRLLVACGAREAELKQTRALVLAGNIGC